jgi:Phage portal protein, SPP1 Gp6-like.
LAVGFGVQEVDPLSNAATSSAKDLKVIQVAEGETDPHYLELVLNAEFERNHIEAILNHIITVAELPMSIFASSSAGVKSIGLTDSGSAMKRALILALNKANRLALFTESAIKELISTLAELEVRSRVHKARILSKVEIEWRAQLPQDPKEEMEVETSLVEHGLSSRRAALIRMNPNISEKELNKELALIAKLMDQKSKNILSGSKQEK